MLLEQRTLKQALLPFLGIFVFLGVWFALGLLVQLLGGESALMRIGLLIAPLCLPMLLVVGLLARSGNATSARAVEALLARPEQLRAITVTTTRRRGGTRHWLTVEARDGTRAEVMFLADPDGLREELRRAFPEVTGGAPPAAAPGASTTKIRHPRELVLVDAQRNVIESSVVVVGGGAKRFARALLASTGGTADGKERDGELDHFVMTLGPIRGWTVQLFVYAIDDSLDAITRVAPDLVAAANATILVQSSPEAARLDPALFPMAKLAGAGKGVLAFVGARSALDELTRDGAPTPSIVGHDGDRGAPDVLKQITGRILSSLRAAA